jgi:hypothetical protein
VCRDNLTINIDKMETTKSIPLTFKPIVKVANDERGRRRTMKRRRRKRRGIILDGFVSKQTYDEALVPSDGSWGQNLQTGRVT